MTHTRRWNPALFACAVGFVLLVSTCAPTPKLSDADSTEHEFPVVAAEVVRVIDGDTARIIFEGKEEPVRFIGMNTPERGRPFFTESTNYALEHLDGKQVWLELDIDPRDKYDRLLAYVWLTKPKSGSEAEIRSQMFNAKILIDGYANIATYPPNVRYVDDFRRYQAEAREAERGLWGE